MPSASLATLWLAILYLAGLGALALVRPSAVRQFLSGFARSTRANVIEAGLRSVVGLAFIGVSLPARHPVVAPVIGIFLVVSALLMLALPDLHRRFAARSTARLFDFLPLFGLASLLLAAALAWFIGGN